MHCWCKKFTPQSRVHLFRNLKSVAHIPINYILKITIDGFTRRLHLILNTIIRSHFTYDLK